MSLSTFKIKKVKKAPSVMFKKEDLVLETKSAKDGDLGLIKINPKDIDKLKPKVVNVKIQTKPFDLSRVPKTHV